MSDEFVGDDERVAQAEVLADEAVQLPKLARFHLNEQHNKERTF